MQSRRRTILHTANVPADIYPRLRRMVKEEEIATRNTAKDRKSAWAESEGRGSREGVMVEGFARAAYQRCFYLLRWEAREPEELPAALDRPNSAAICTARAHTHTHKHTRIRAMAVFIAEIFGMGKTLDFELLSNYFCFFSLLECERILWVYFSCFTPVLWSFSFIL